MTFLRSAAAAALLCALAAPATALTFTDRAAFEAAVTGTADLAPAATGFAASQAVGGVTFSVHTGATSLGFSESFSSLLTNELAISGPENFIISFGGLVGGFGMDIHEPTSTVTLDGCNVTPCVDSSFEISAFNGGTLVGSATISPDDNALDFIGIAFAQSFNEIRVTETVGTQDNELFGNFTIAEALIVSDVPVPAAAPLLAAALAGLGLLRRRG
ncbi:hypothetical protein ACQ5SO_00510 [Rhodovulum sp. DZ06]|uniref:hypothetical protein n=1 Tax=Rhodovulum sp. DZ06 TaxID=3425126 RepID=UPI003D352A68